MRAGGVRRAVVVVVLAAAFLLPGAAADAHAFLAGSNPADGEVVAQGPPELRLSFSESVVLEATRIDVVDGDGHAVAVSGLHLEGGDAQDTEEPVEVVAALPTLDRGAYRVSWSTLSSDDLHPTTGFLVFGVGQDVAAAGVQEPAPRPVEALLRWVLLAALAGTLGGALAQSLLRVVGDQPRAARLRRWTRVAAAAAVVAAPVLLVHQVATSGAAIGSVLTPSLLVRGGLREAGLLLLLATTTARWPAAGPPRRAVGVVGAVLACLGTASLGHSAATPGLGGLTRVAASAAHLGAAACWSGCLVVLAVALVRGPATGRGATARAVFAAFGPPAAACVSVLVVTGVYLSSQVVGSVDAALLTVYGRTLLAKVLLAGLAGALALVNTVRLRRPARGAWRVPAATIRGEALVAVVLLVLAAVVTSGQPAMEPQLVRADVTATDAPADRTVGDLQEVVDVRPARPGPNVVTVELYDTRRPAPSPVRAVRITVTGADGRTGPPIEAVPLGAGRWSATTDLAEPGAVHVDVVASRPGMPDLSATYEWTVGTPTTGVTPPVVSATPLRPVLEGLALALLVAVLAAWGYADVRVRRSRRPPAVRSQEREPAVVEPVGEPDPLLVAMAASDRAGSGGR